MRFREGKQLVQDYLAGKFSVIMEFKYKHLILDFPLLYISYREWIAVMLTLGFQR